MIELWILAGIITGAVISIFFVKIGSDAYSMAGMIMSMIGVFMAIVVFIITVVYCFLIFDWHAAKYKAEIINREYKTNYSREDVFYAPDVIDIIREIDRNRIEINGNIMKK